jgi:hypothetical protein
MSLPAPPVCWSPATPPVLVRRPKRGLRSSDFGLRISAGAPGHARNRPTDDTGKPVSAPASFRPARRGPEWLPARMSNSSVRSGSDRAARTTRLAPARASTGKGAHPESKCVGQGSRDLQIIPGWPLAIESFTPSLSANPLFAGSPENPSPPRQTAWPRWTRAPPAPNPPAAPSRADATGTPRATAA